MAATFELQIMALDRVVYEGEVESIVAKGTEGFLGVLAHHAPLVTELAAGDLTVTVTKNTVKTFTLDGGLLEVGGNKAVILADGQVKEAEG
jgi:F-type H+-transporting ATPase subunit epsilon